MNVFLVLSSFGRATFAIRYCLGQDLAAYFRFELTSSSFPLSSSHPSSLLVQPARLKMHDYHFLQRVEVQFVLLATSSQLQYLVVAVAA